jgi:hypothetical protein
MLFSRVVFYLIYFSFAIAFLAILSKFLLCNPHFLHTDLDSQNIARSLENVKKIFLFNEEDSSDRPVDSKESSYSIKNKIEVCHQQVCYTEDGEPTFVICSEQKSSVLTKNVFTTNYPAISKDQLFLLKHYVNMVEIRGCVFDKNYEDSLLLVNAYTHSGNPNYNVPNLLVSRLNLYGFNRYQYSTQLYHFDKQFLNFTGQSDLRLQQFEGYSSDQVVPIRFLPRICKHGGLLITGSNEFIQETIKSPLLPIKFAIDKQNKDTLFHFSKTPQKPLVKGIKSI